MPSLQKELYTKQIEIKLLMLYLAHINNQLII